MGYKEKLKIIFTCTNPSSLTLTTDKSALRLYFTNKLSKFNFQYLFSVLNLLSFDFAVSEDFFPENTA